MSVGEDGPLDTAYLASPKGDDRSVTQVSAYRLGKHKDVSLLRYC